MLQAGSQESRAEGESHLPCPAGHTAFSAAPVTISFLGYKHTLPGHVEHQHPQVLLRRAVLNPFSTQPVSMLGIALAQVQDLALGFIELHEV